MSSVVVGRRSRSRSSFMNHSTCRNERLTPAAAVCL